MEARFFKFPNITNFEEVYIVIDKEKKRLHMSPVNYSYSITLNLDKFLNEQIEQYTKYGESNFNIRVRKVLKEIVKELNLDR
ncbi:MULTISPECIES: hypothetical protein [Niallia]|uniref:Uncharacterized protein n=1 Tax=Niallia circulans TaxID=1397 RepID=A0A941GH26_NIACI|nr:MULTISPECIES: hypothetical protein [Niallia]MCB5237186.1 hypothetical protein [Niallia circulans]MED3795650.1 hypothetical protein [Niallia alba]